MPPSSAASISPARERDQFRRQRQAGRGAREQPLRIAGAAQARGQGAPQRGTPQ